MIRPGAGEPWTVTQAPTARPSVASAGAGRKAPPKPMASASETELWIFVKLELIAVAPWRAAPPYATSTCRRVPHSPAGPLRSAPVEEVALADAHAAVPQDGVGRRGVEIEIGQRERNEI